VIFGSGKEEGEMRESSKPSKVMPSTPQPGQKLHSVKMGPWLGKHSRHPRCSWRADWQATGCESCERVWGVG
jgi:hypothetical protein